MRDALCAVCGRREPARGLVCEADRKRLAEQLAELPGQIARIDRNLVPAASTALDGDRVRVTRVDAPLPVRTDALSLAGPGSEDVEWMPALAALHPAVRRWTTRHTVVVERRAGAEVVREERTIILWHRALVPGVDDPATGHRYPVLVDDDDQAGVVPPREWLDVWARRFRLHFGHHVPRRTFPRRPQPPRVLDADERLLEEEVRMGRVRTVLGIGGYVKPVDRPDDPLAEEWDIRFGAIPTDKAVAGNVRYLLTWLDRACDNHPDIGELAAELRSLAAELGRVLGERPDQQWLGRCPAVVVDHADGEDSRRACGAGLWQDPHASQVRCPRCQSVWGPDPRALLQLAGEIRTAWPLDRRRRYCRREITNLPALACSGCGQPLHVRWREVTAPAVDRERWWRCVGVSCSNRCPDAGKGV